MKLRKEFRLEEEYVLYIEQIKNDFKLPSEASSLEKIIYDHKHKEDISVTDKLIKDVTKGITEELNKILTRIRLGTTNADRNSDIIILLLNEILRSNGIRNLNPEKTEVLISAERIEKEKIDAFKARKSNNEFKKKTGTKTIKDNNNSVLNPLEHLDDPFVEIDLV